MSKWNLVIVGGGIAGLIAANLAATSNKRIVVLEKSEELGGRARTINKNGVQLNLGAHAIYNGGDLMTILQELGIRLSGGSPANQATGIWKNQLYTLPSTPLSLLSFPLLSWQGKMELGQLMMKLGKINYEAVPAVSLREWAERHVKEPMVRHIFYALCRTGTYGNLPDLQLAAPVLLQVQRSLKSGVFYVDGGWSSLIEKLKERALRLGVTLLQHNPAVRIEHDEGRVQGVRCEDGCFLETEAVVIAAPPAIACKLVPGSERTALGRWQRQSLPLTAACLDLGLRRLPKPKQQFVIGLDLPLLFTNQSRAAKLSEDGTQAVHVLKYHEHGETDAAADEREMERALDLIQPGWRSEVVARQYLPRMTVVHDYPHMTRSHQPEAAVPEIHGLYVAGDGFGQSELLVDAAAASAKRAANLVLKQVAEREVILR